MKQQPRKIAVKFVRSAKKIQVKVFSVAKMAMRFEFTKVGPYHPEPIGGSKRADTILAVNITMAVIVVLGVVFMYLMRQNQ